MRYADGVRHLLTPGAVLAMLLVGTPARAHEGGGAHWMGTVKEIAGDRIVLATKEGKVVTIPIVARTRISRGDQAIAPSDVRAGERVVVHSTMQGGKLQAAEIRVASTPK